MTFWQLLIVLLILGFIAYAIVRWGGKFLEPTALKIIVGFVLVVMVLLILGFFGVFGLLPAVPVPRVH